MTRYTFAILTNGREVDNLDPGTFATEAEARAAAEDALDLCCPAGSGERRYYRVEIRPVKVEPAKHTPGPWKNDGPTRQGGVRIVAPYKPRCTYMVAEVLPDCPDDATRDANARLIAAAPDLLAACEAMLPHLEAMIERANPAHEDTSHYSDQTAVRLARAAIAKAR